MTANSVFVPVRERGWRRGLGNLMRAGFAEWWGTRTWWVHALIWTGVLNLMLLGIGLSGDSAVSADALGFVALFGGLFPVVAVVIIMQGAIVGEKQNGTAAWIMSKPVSRTAYIVAKLVPNAAGMAIAMLLIPMIVGWAVASLMGAGVALPRFVAGYCVVALNMLFFLTLTVMLGAMSKRRGGVIGIALGLLFGQQYLVSAVPALSVVMPWGLCLPLGDEFSSSVATSVMLGIAPPSWLPVVFAAAATVVFTAIAIWRFRRVEL